MQQQDRGFETFTTAADLDGDRVEIRWDGPRLYGVKVINADGDFMTAFVTADEILELAERVRAQNERGL